MHRIYLDWAATAVPDAQSLNAALGQTMADFGNPSSPHQRGKDASAVLSGCRKKLSGSFSCSPNQLFFTAGGTESNNIVLMSLLNKNRKGNLVISGIEHSSVYEPAMLLEKHGWEVRIVPSGADGIVDPENFCKRMDSNTFIASMMMVNNETGAIQPVEEIGNFISAGQLRVHFHIDAVQAAGKIQLNMNSLHADSVSISSHKFRGPRGAGLLYLKKPLVPVYSGGGQENGIRHGTENMYAVLGTSLTAAKAVEAVDANLEHALRLKKILTEQISKIKNAIFLPHNNISDLLNPEKFSPYILSVGIRPVPGEILVRVMSDRGFDIATGSACATGKKKKSRVMEAMGVNPETAFSTVRISTGPATTIDEIEQFCDTFKRESAILIKQLSR